MIIFHDSDAVTIAPWPFAWPCPGWQNARLTGARKKVGKYRVRAHFS
jgi:hypothetical protein